MKFHDQTQFSQYVDKFNNVFLEDIKDNKPDAMNYIFNELKEIINSKVDFIVATYFFAYMSDEAKQDVITKPTEENKLLIAEYQMIISLLVKKYKFFVLNHYLKSEYATDADQKEYEAYLQDGGKIDMEHFNKLVLNVRFTNEMEKSVLHVFIMAYLKFSAVCKDAFATHHEKLKDYDSFDAFKANPPK